MYYVDPPGTAPAIAKKRKHNFWPLIVPVTCVGTWLGIIAIFLGPHVAGWFVLAVVLAVGAVGLLALLPVAEGLDTLGIGH